MAGPHCGCRTHTLPYHRHSWLHLVSVETAAGGPGPDPNGVRMGVMLADSQRDEVYQYLLVDVGGVADMTTLIRGGELDLARRLRSRFEEDMRLLDQIGWEPKGEKAVYVVTLASDEIRSIFRRLLAYVLQIINAPHGKSALTLSRAAGMAEIARIVLNELPGGTRTPRS
jgi:hypothetical protein